MVGQFVSMILAKFAAVVQWIAAALTNIFVSLWLIFTDIFSWLFEQVLTVAISGIGSLNVAGLTGYVSSVGTMPAQILNVLGLLGIGTAISIISAAITIRLALQLIPFTRLGS